MIRQRPQSPIVGESARLVFDIRSGRPISIAPIVARCSCGRQYTEAQWRKLKLIGKQSDGEGGWLELRNCACRSTRAIPIPLGRPVEPRPSWWQRLWGWLSC